MMETGGVQAVFYLSLCFFCLELVVRGRHELPDQRSHCRRRTVCFRIFIYQLIQVVQS